jgi:hypothetical protein
MKKHLAVVMLTAAASAATIAMAQTGAGQMTEPAGPPAAMSSPDARSLASDQEVGEARRFYRAQCERHQSHTFCECVTAGVAQALMPAEVRMAARTIGERINAEGDAPLVAGTDRAPVGATSQDRIEQAESHYADACAQFRR